MDIEGYEYPVLRSIIDSRENAPLQIGVELHYQTYAPLVALYGRLSPTYLFAFSNYMHTFGGYHLIDKHDNPGCAHCTEVVYAKLNCKIRNTVAGHRGDNSTGRNFYNHLNKQAPSKLKLVIDGMLN